jgi:hypothetical protein
MKIRKRITAILAVSLVSAQVSAAPVTLPQTLSNGFGSTSWQIVNTGGTSTGLPYTGTCNSGVGVTVQDATGPTGAGDAFDNAYEMFVNNTVVAQTTGDLTGSTLTMNPVTITGLNVTLQYFAVPGVALLRTLVTLHNPTGSTIATRLDVPVNFGSDAGSIIQTTSSGDTTITTADRWVISSDSGPSDPVNTTAMFQTGASVPPSAYTQVVFSCAATNGLGGTFNINIPAGASVSFVFFAGLGGITTNNNTVAGATTGAHALFDTPNALANAGAFAGLSPQQLSTLANWGPVTLTAANQSVPTLSEWALVVLGLLLAVVGAVALRRRTFEAAS